MEYQDIAGVYTRNINESNSEPSLKSSSIDDVIAGYTFEY